MDSTRNILTENVNEYFEFAERALKEKKFNAATTLFFKALAALADLFIYLNEGKVPSSHSQRFRILEEKYPEIYKILDRDFPFYQDSYTMKMNEEAAKLLENDAKQLKKRIGI